VPPIVVGRSVTLWFEINEIVRAYYFGKKLVAEGEEGGWYW